MPTLGNTPRPAYVYDTETDTWVPVGVGAHTHSDIPNTLVDAKGDLITATADNVPARLAKGADGTVLVSDSTTSTGLAWQPYAAIQVAGKNKILNGDFSIWQRGSSFTSPSDNIFVADRWRQNGDGTKGTRIWSRQSFTPGEISGYESQYYMRFQQSVAGSGASYQNILIQPIEDVRTLAGKTVTISFWAKADTAGRTLGSMIYRFFGTGSPTSADVVMGSTATLTTSWQRYSTTVTIPSVSGKTISSSDHATQLILYPTFNIAQTIDIWGIQLEEGSVATPFTTATGTIAGELAACQRYYSRSTVVSNYGYLSNMGTATSTTNCLIRFNNPVIMRTTPTSIDFSAVQLSPDDSNIFPVTNITFGVGVNASNVMLMLTSSGLTQFRPYYPAANGNSSAFIGISAEL